MITLFIIMVLMLIAGFWIECAKIALYILLFVVIVFGFAICKTFFNSKSDKHKRRYKQKRKYRKVVNKNGLEYYKPID